MTIVRCIVGWDAHESHHSLTGTASLGGCKIAEVKFQNRPTPYYFYHYSTKGTVIIQNYDNFYTIVTRRNDEIIQQINAFEFSISELSKLCDIEYG